MKNAKCRAANKEKRELFLVQSLRFFIFHFSLVTSPHLIKSVTFVPNHPASRFDQ